MNIRHFIKYTSLALIAAALLVSCVKDQGGQESFDGKINGIITFEDGSAAAGVVVSDGYTCTQTDADGKYTLEVNKNSFFVNYSIPSDAAIVTGGTYDLPVFFKRIDRNKSQSYDFKLTRQDVEKEFRIMTFGDIQTSNSTHIKRFTGEAVPAISKFVSDHTDLPVYAIHLGDITTNKWDLWPDILPYYGKNKLGMPMFSVIGNHDHVFPSANNIAAQRNFENTICPVTYSFNRGDVHFICADDIIHGAQTSPGYDGGFLTFQYEWMKQDLSYVSKDKNVVLCVHIPFRDAFYKTNNLADHPGAYYNEVLALLSQYKSATIISGHLHTIKNFYVHQSGGKTIQEYSLSALCGASWTSNLCADGTPMGWDVFTFNGSTLKDMYFQSAKMPASHQMRIYYAPDFPNFQGTVDGVLKTIGWGLVTLDNTYIVNIFNMTDEWKTEVFLDGVSQGSLKRKDFSDAYLQTYYKTAHPSSLSDTRYHHLYYFRPGKSFTEMKVVATDQFGNKYECNKITKPGDPEVSKI